MKIFTILNYTLLSCAQAVSWSEAHETCSATIREIASENKFGKSRCEEEGSCCIFASDCASLCCDDNACRGFEEGERGKEGEEEEYACAEITERETSCGAKEPYIWDEENSWVLLCIIGVIVGLCLLISLLERWLKIKKIEAAARKEAE